MILSMTGYGTAQHAENGLSYALEVRTVNNRYLKLSLKLPDSLQFAEAAVEKLVRSRIARGTVDYTLRVRGSNGDITCALNVARLQEYVRQLASIALPGSIQASIDLAVLAGLPGVCEQPTASEELRPRQWEIVERLTQSVLDSVATMRKEEGESLRRDLFSFCQAIRERLALVTERAPGVIDEYHQRLRMRVSALLKVAELELESDGLMREVAIFAERCDISEELSRLASHLDQFGELCDRPEQVGRTLDFLTQELLREANTIASKSNDAVIVRNIVEIKGLIDRLREQVQNVE